MILHDETVYPNFPRYGIGIPARDSRKIRTLNALREDSYIGQFSGQWLIDGYDDVVSPRELYLVHSTQYVDGFFNEKVQERLIDAYELMNPDGTYNRWAPEQAQSPLADMVPHIMKSIGGVYRSSRIALDEGFCHFLGGGTHHGHRDFGHGFCPFNDAALAIRWLMKEKFIRNAWIIDLDAHKGDGTAAIFTEDEKVKTLSIHMAKGWPLDGSLAEGHPVYIPSDFDIPIDVGEECTYLDRLEKSLQSLQESSCADFVIVLAGVDPWEGDGLPSTSLMKLTEQQLFDRDCFVFNFLEKAGLPSAWLTAGGYGENAWIIHANFLSWVLAKRLN